MLLINSITILFMLKALCFKNYCVESKIAVKVYETRDNRQSMPIMINFS